VALLAREMRAKNVPGHYADDLRLFVEFASIC